MAHQYRLSRNIEASIVQQLETALVADGWSGIRTEKAFARVYEGDFPCILVQVLNRPVKRKEIGSNSIFYDAFIQLKIFANNDGVRLDLSDWLLEQIMDEFNYYIYTIDNGAVQIKTLSGHIRTLRVLDNRKEFDNTENLDNKDRYRHLFNVECRVALS